jgi:hypothetical protein
LGKRHGRQSQNGDRSQRYLRGHRFHHRSPFSANGSGSGWFLGGTISASGHCIRVFAARKELSRLRKLIAFDDDTFDKLKQLGRDRMATFQELADEAFADLLKKHGVPIDLRDALRKSAGVSKKAPPKNSKHKARKAQE